MTLKHVVFVMLALAALAVPAQAEEQMSGRYAVRALGLKVGELALAGSVSDRRYTVSAQFVTTGLVGAVKGVRFLLSASGRRRGARFRPERYAEDMDTGRRESRVSLRYSGGVARASGSEVGDRGPFAVTPAQQRGAVDPLTGMFMVLRDQPANALCRVRQKVFDGERLTEIVLTERRAEGDRITCTGVFRRVAGYSPEDLEKGRFGLQVTYEPAGDLMRAVKMRADTVYGPADLVRR